MGAQLPIEVTVRSLSYNPKKRLSKFRELDFSEQVRVFRLLSKYVAKDLAHALSEQELVAILEKLDPDEASNILRFFSKKKQDKLIGKLNTQLQEDIGILLSFNPGTAAQLMSLNYVFVSTHDKMKSVSAKVKQHESRTGKLPTVLVLDGDELKGNIPGYVLGIAYPGDAVSKHVTAIPTIHYATSQKKVLDFFRRNPHSKVVVLGKNNNVLGLIYSDDIIRVMHQQESASLYDFAGLNHEESIYDPAYRKFHFRYKWLLINLCTTFLAAFTVGLFEDVIAREVLLAVYMPIVAGMGGNAGTQTLAVMVRGLAFTELTFADVLRTLSQEVMSGLANGLLNGMIVFSLVYFVQGNALVATVLACAMIVNLVTAATFGTLVPVLLSKLGKDPASSATVFITTATDVFGFMVFLGLASVLLGLV